MGEHGIVRDKARKIKALDNVELLANFEPGARGQWGALDVVASISG